ncbi:TadE/TadG family type IV pilus assembly protein [Tropicimonas marinistellae]|uniref:TadE/TadG family type IV pilus assembly protein n=1 Tax=Tropicimonas marinistellae TaxID=1739787 RepID=UPI00082BB653|nr:TadE family protein [Tropicimonas marinistellae]
MTRPEKYGVVGKRLADFGSDEAGTSLVEFAMVLSLFLLIFFGLIDFGRLAFHYVTAEKAVQRAARVAAVRPPVCDALYDNGLNESKYPTNQIAVDNTEFDFGARCNAGASTGKNVCKTMSVSCSGDAGDPTSSEIWRIVRTALPNDASEANLRFSYNSDPNLGFLGGPYVPVVTVELQNVNFQFLGAGALAGSVLAGLTEMSGATPPKLLKDGFIEFPALSVSLPAEDLAQGMDG